MGENINFQNGTIVTPTWLNEVNSLKEVSFPSHLAGIVTVPAANKIPKANANGKLNVNWLDFAEVKSDVGYTKLPNGIIIQWITVQENTKTTDDGGGITLTFPIAFPNNAIGAWTEMEPTNSADTTKIIGTFVASNTTFAVVTPTRNTLFPRKLRCFAIGW